MWLGSIPNNYDPQGFTSYSREQQHEENESPGPETVQFQLEQDHWLRAFIAEC